MAGEKVYSVFSKDTSSVRPYIDTKLSKVYDNHLKDELLPRMECTEIEPRKEGTNMAFKVAFLAHTPDAEPERHRCVIETPKFKLYSVLVRSQDQAVAVCKKLAEEEGIHSILLCPGFTHKDIADISEAVGKNVGVSVARGDGPSRKITLEVMKREGWFLEE